MPAPNADLNLKATVVILGGTGELGNHISNFFLTEYRQTFPTVRITTRDPSSTKAKELAAKGAEVYAFSESLDVILTGATVVVNVLPTPICASINKELVPSLLKHGVKVYFPSEFASDYRVLDFPGFEHEEWTGKRALNAEARAIAQDNLKVISLMTGAFTSWVFRPDRTLGVDLMNNRYSCLGPTSARFATTDLTDIGRAVAQLSVLALDPETAGTIPDTVRIAGQVVSMEDIRDAAARVSGREPGEIVSGDLAAVKESLRKNFPNPPMSIIDYARVNIGQGGMDFTDNDNELVNPGESLWKWRTIEEELRAWL
ncbi:hypothetical protein C8Q76DRAFT_620621 [Earliella scabrosa]|nr:hypothetical protein C8Q76DRAFT_620621 [Earliella scabrosa]